MKIEESLSVTANQIKELAKFLMEKDTEVMDKHGWIATKYRPIPPKVNYEQYKKEIVTAIRYKMTPALKISHTASAWIYDILEDKNYHMLNNVLIEIGFYT